MARASAPLNSPPSAPAIAGAESAALLEAPAARYLSATTVVIEWNVPEGAQRCGWPLYWQLFVRQAYTNLKLTVHKTPTDNEKADLLTKPLPKDAGLFRDFRNWIMNCS